MRRLIGIALLAFGLLQLSFRGMQRVRNDIPLWDFVSVHAASRTWIHGGNPYDIPSVVDTWRQSGIFADRDVSYFAAVYPPTSFLMLIPLAVLDARAAMLLWLVITFALLAAQFAALASMMRLRWSDSRVVLLIGAVIACAPIQFGILAGQLSVPAISLCVIAFWCNQRGRDILAGVLLGIACGLKVQIGAPFVVYYLLTRRFKVFWSSAILAGIIGIVAFAAMQWSHPDWLTYWTQRVADTTQPGAVNDYGWANRFRDEIVDLKLLLVSFIAQPTTLKVASLLVVGMLGVGFLVTLFRGPKPSTRDELLVLGAFSALTLLPIYHRVYDVALLCTALAWALVELDGPRRRYAIGLLIPMAVFLVPFDIIKSVGNRIPGLVAASKTGWFQTLIVPHYAWALLIVTIGLLITLSRRGSEATAEVQQSAPAHEPVSPAPAR